MPLETHHLLRGKTGTNDIFELLQSVNQTQQSACLIVTQIQHWSAVVPSRFRWRMGSYYLPLGSIAHQAISRAAL